MDYPRVYLAIDNCFASKRWTDPLDWMKVIKDLGINYVEASADNECDPLYMGSEYLDDWVKKVKKASENTGVKVVNLYSGHGTYTTLGLAHTDKKIRDRFLHKWIKPMIIATSKIDSGLGFFCHAFSDSTLQDKVDYENMEAELYNILAQASDIANEYGCKSIGVEQMYTPHQIPWTIEGAFKLLRTVNTISENPFYITIDTGHQSSQRNFICPSYGKVKEMVAKYRAEGFIESTWLGPISAYQLILKASEENGYLEDIIIKELENEMDKYPHMFSKYEDGDTYIWLEKLACYSPIIHLQQTSGKSSSHWPFTKDFNEKGIISGEKLLKAISCSYESKHNVEGLPTKCKEIYLTLEIFSGTADINIDILRRIKESVEYWRKYIPEDGLTLDNLLSQLNN